MREAVGMDTLITLGLLAVVLAPLFIVVRDLVRTRPRSASRMPEVRYETTSTMSTFPSLATLKSMEDTAPTFVRAREWWSE